MRHSDIARKESLARLIPDLFDHRTFLYIGASSRRFDLAEELQEHCCEVTVIEAHQPNVEHLRTIPWLKDVIRGDVRTFETGRRYDIVIWWHGPEHVRESELAPTLSRIEMMVEKAVVLGCPWGISPQGPVYGNPFEVHASHHDHHVFEQLGYTVECLGQKDVPGSHITAVKHISPTR